MQTRDYGQRRFLLAVFVVSGFTGLIYESIWSHYLKLFLGHAAYAQTLVLSIFMGGMALGAWLVAYYSSRIRQLLWAYVLVEGLIGMLGIVFHQSFVATTQFSFASVIPALPTPLLIQAYKWSLGSLLILPQSILLGMTFPLISGGLIRRWPQQPGATLATLYFTNSLGAAIGVLVSGFVLIGAVGLPGTILTAGVLNIALALAVWTVVRKQSEPQPSAGAAPELPADRDRLAAWFLIAAFLTGTASFMYEIGWIRMLSLVLGSSTHSFELMLSAFIFGLAFGGLYVRRRIETLADPASYLACVMVAMGALAALTLPAYNLTFDFMAWCLGIFTRTASGYVAFNLVSQLIAAVVMIPATFCAGMTLPLLTQALMRRGTGERAIGAIYAANTLGAIVGVLVTIHLLMPHIGVKGIIVGGAAIHIALGVSRLVAGRRYPARAATVTIAACLAVFAFAAFGVKLDPARRVSGVYRTGFATLPTDAHVAYLRDGKTATISLIEQDGTVVIATNGKPDAGVNMGPGEAALDESTMVLAAALPLSMHPHPARVANIGFGSGLTTHALLMSDLVKRLDSIEIEPFMVEAARKAFSPRIDNVFSDPRSHIVFEDAKTFFASSREPYDLIVSEPSNPWVSGVATLFSDEFYAHIVKHLAGDGYFVQWMQIYETNIEVLASVIKAMAPHFETYALYYTDASDILIIASRGAALPAPDNRLVSSELLQAEFKRVGIQSVTDIALRKLGDNRTIGPMLQSMQVPANSDYFPFIDLNAPRLRFMAQNAVGLTRLPVLPIPFLELLDGDAARIATVEPAANSRQLRDGMLRRALEIRSAVASDSLNTLDPMSATYLSRIDMSRERCAGPEGQLAWKTAVRNISDETVAYLNAQELQPIWSKVKASACYQAAASGSRLWADLFAAIAQRDAGEIAKLGSALLESHLANSDEEVAYLTTVSAAAYVRLGDTSAANTLLRTQLPRLSDPGQYELALRELLALFQPPHAANTARTSR